MKLFGRKMNSYSIAILYRQLAVMLAIGIRADEAFNTLAEESDDPRIKTLSTLIQKDLSTGTSLGDSLKKYPKIFNNVLVDILLQEEQGEKASKALTIMADASEKTGNMKSKVFQALFFPIITLIVATIACGIIMVFVVPVFKEMFADFGAQLPVPTQIVINTSDWVVRNILYIFIGIVIMVAGLKNQKIKYKIGSTIPGLRVLLKKSSIIQFARHLSIMLSLDVSLKEAFVSSAGALNNPLHSGRLKNIGDKIYDTKQLKEEMRFTGIFPKIILKMIDAGETSNSLELVFGEISKFYEKDFDRSLHRNLSVLKVFAVFFVGIFVGGVVLSMYLPMFKMAGAVG